MVSAFGCGFVFKRSSIQLDGFCSPVGSASPGIRELKSGQKDEAEVMLTALVWCWVLVPLYSVGIPDTQRSSEEGGVGWEELPLWCLEGRGPGAACGFLMSLPCGPMWVPGHRPQCSVGRQYWDPGPLATEGHIKGFI